MRVARPTPWHPDGATRLHLAEVDARRWNERLSHGVEAHVSVSVASFMHVAKPNGSCALHRRCLGRLCGITMASWFCSPSQGRFLPRLRAAPRGRPFFCLRTCCGSASPADMLEAFATPYGAVAGGPAMTGWSGPVLRSSSVKPRSGGRVRIGVTGNWTPQSAGPWPWILSELDRVVRLFSNRGSWRPATRRTPRRPNPTRSWLPERNRDRASSRAKRKGSLTLQHHDNAYVEASPPHIQGPAMDRGPDAVLFLRGHAGRGE